MEVDKPFTKIKEFGHTNSRRDELREYCKLKIEHIKKFLPRRILNSDGGDLLDCILNGLSDNTKNRIQIVDIVLHTMRKESTSLTHCGNVVSRLCLEVPRLPADHLVRWCNDSVQSIVDDSDVNMIGGLRVLLRRLQLAVQPYAEVVTQMCQHYLHMIVDIVLHTMRKESTSLTHCGNVVSRLCLEVPRLPADHLVRWCNDSVQSIVDDSDVNMIWRDVLPECLSALSAHSTVKHCGTEMSTAEYKEQCVSALCQCRWQEKQLVQLTAMFKDMQLSRNDHRKALNKICSCVVDIPPDTLPPLLHQMLKLCKSYHVEIVLAHLSHYFSIRLYSKLEPPQQDSESTTVDIDDIVPHSPVELSRCLSTCIYHISQGPAEPELIRRHLKSWPKTQLLRAPFLLDLALALSDKGSDFRSVCLDVIKSAIEQRATDELRRKESALSRSVLPPDVEVASVLKVLTTESANHRQLTVTGLINLAFALLSVSRLKPTAPACWSHGKLILVRLSKAQPETAPHILSQLADRLATDCARQYADCLHVLCTLSPVSVERCAQLSAILENCAPSPTDHRAAAAVFDAVHPLLNFSIRARDTLVMVCRKGLYFRDSMHRCLALSGLLTVLRHVKVSRTFSSSQEASSEQYSAHSYLTQLTLDLHATHQGGQVTSRVRNEAMCMEVVSILRRCLVQDAVVKQLLYTNIYECAKEKPVLHESILELLHEHLGKYLPQEDADRGCLQIDRCVQVTATSAVLVEPISRLLYTVAQFLQPAEDEDLEDILASQSADTGSAYLKSKLAAVLERLCCIESLARINMEDPGLSDLTAESKAKCVKVQQILQCYEALIAHQVMQWGAGGGGGAAAGTVYKLFKACNQLLDQTKSTPKMSKKSSKSTLNETRDTVKSQKSQKSQKDKGKGPTKVSGLVKDRAGPFKPLPCVWDLKFCLRVVELLYNESVPWSTAEQRNQLVSRRDFHHWALRCVLSALADNADKRRARTAADIAAVLYRRCLCRFEDMCNFDEQTILFCIELFKECLSTLFSANYSFKMDKFLPTITDLTDSSGSASIAAILEQLHSALAHIETESVAEQLDATGKRLVAALVQTAALLLETPVLACAETGAVVIKLEEYIRSSKQDCLPLLPSILAAGCREQPETQLLDDLLLKLTAALGRIDEEDTSAGAEVSSNFPAIDSRSGHAVLSHICAHLNVRYKCTEHLLQRARDLTAALCCAVHEPTRERIDRELKELYKSVVIQLHQLTAWTSRVGKLRCSVGGGSDRVLTACVRLYGLLATLTKQLDPPTAQLVRFERLLKSCCKKLSTVTDNLISYLEGSQQQQSATKVLRDTKLIPRLVLEAEQFTKHVVLLGSKAKVDFQQYLSLGTARDFRIKGPALQEALQANQRDAPREPDVDINEVSTALSPVQSDNEEGGDEEASGRKRRRVS